MINPFKKLKNWNLRRAKPAKTDLKDLFRKKYALFKELLASNAEILDMIADMEEKLQGRQVFGMSYIRAKSTRAVFHTHRMVKCLNDLSQNRYALLYDKLKEIREAIKDELSAGKDDAFNETVLPYTKVTREVADYVGYKNANLGEIYNRLDLPIPEGFAITTRAFDLFFAHNDLVDTINTIKTDLDPQDPRTVPEVSEEIQRKILLARVPGDLERDILSEYDRIAEVIRQKHAGNASGSVALRSSAIGEDGELSFAGQYLTSLNVPRHKIIDTYKYIVASLYTPRAIYYRLSKGIRDEDLAMSVACIQMIESVASGIMYSRHPSNPSEQNTITINAVWGLGPYAVDGVITPDSYKIERGEGLTLLETKISNKPVKLVSNPDGGLREVPVPEAQQNSSCLSEEQIQTLAAYALKLEEHFGCPQDTEWALDTNGQLVVLQTRPLRIDPLTQKEGSPSSAPVQGYPVLVQHAAAACPGVGFGPAVRIHSDKELMDFPEGGILIARHSSPKFVVAMRKARGIVADSGSVLGHMASLSREFSVPTLLDAKNAFDRIPDGMEITVDADTGHVYQGKVQELFTVQRVTTPFMKETPIYQALRRVADLIIPLHLIDPRSHRFSPRYCKTLHDIMRFVHESSYREMFKISDVISGKGEGALKLDAPIPLDLFIIDMENGLTGVAPHDKKASLDHIACVPLKALLRGMSHEDFRTNEPRPVDIKGFFSVMSEQMLSAPANALERFGDPSYAIISDKYLNFSSRVGYHYSVLDSYCGQKVNKNYITFSFKGGAADEVRRERRTRAIARMLEAHHFVVDGKGDRVDARYQKYEAALIEEKLEVVGRLLMFTRQMDMLMTNDASVDKMAAAFLEGNYKLR